MRRITPISVGLMAALASAPPMQIRGRDYFGGREPYRPEKRGKKACLECGEPHNHNNSWCSPECCHVYRSKNK